MPFLIDQVSSLQTPLLPLAIRDRHLLMPIDLRQLHLLPITILQTNLKDQKVKMNHQSEDVHQMKVTKKRQPEKEIGLEENVIDSYRESYV